MQQLLICFYLCVAAVSVAYGVAYTILFINWVIDQALNILKKMTKFSIVLVLLLTTSCQMRIRPDSKTGLNHWDLVYINMDFSAATCFFPTKQRKSYSYKGDTCIVSSSSMEKVYVRKILTPKPTTNE